MVRARLAPFMGTMDESEVRRAVREAVERALGPESAPAAATAAAARRVAIGSDHGGYGLKEVL